MGGPSAQTVARIRHRAAAATDDIDLSEEELQALADEGVDPEDIQILARTVDERDDISEFDRDGELDGLVGEEDSY